MSGPTHNFLITLQKEESKAGSEEKGTKKGKTALLSHDFSFVFRERSKMMCVDKW